MTNIIPVDEEQLRVEIQKHYAEVAVSPDHEFHTGREAARKVGYSDAILEDIPDEVIASFDGVARPFHFGLPRFGDTSSTWDPEPEPTPSSPGPRSTAVAGSSR